MDELHGGTGNDTLVYDEADHLVDGGTGTDTLRVDGAGTIIDLPETADDVFTGIEIIDLTGTGDNRLILGEADVLAMSDTGTLEVRGDGGDIVNLDGTWTADGTDGDGNFRYVSGEATVLVAPEVTIASVIHGTDGADTLSDSTGDHVIRGEEGDDTLTGGTGDHVLDGGAG